MARRSSLVFNDNRALTRILVYAVISTLVVAFGALGAMIADFVAPDFALPGLLLGSSLGAAIAVHEATVIGCVFGMTGGMVLAPFVFVILDFETCYMMVFIFSLFGAFLGEPIAHFWREANEIEDATVPDQFGVVGDVRAAGAARQSSDVSDVDDVSEVSEVTDVTDASGVAVVGVASSSVSGPRDV